MSQVFHTQKNLPPQLNEFKLYEHKVINLNNGYYICLLNIYIFLPKSDLDLGIGFVGPLFQY